MNNDRVEVLLQENIAAANRTTRAVRGLARFLLIEVTSTLIGIALIVLGLFGQDLFIFLGSVILLVGLIWAATSLKSELDKSQIPNGNSPALQPLLGDQDRVELRPQDMDIKDWYVYSSLSQKEKQAWRDKGMPSLRNWDGRRSLEEWLTDYPFSDQAK